MNAFFMVWNFIWGWVSGIVWPWVSLVVWPAVAAFAVVCWQTLWKPGVLPVAIVAAVAGAILGAWAMHHYVDQPAYDHLKAGYETRQAQATAVIHQAAASSLATQATLSQASGAKFEATRTRIVTQTETITKEIPVYVTVQSDAVPCNSVGLVRVLNAAAEGRDPADYQLPPGVTDDTCTALTNAAVAASVSANYGTARLNAGQLDDLEADVKTRIDAANSAVVSQPLPAIGSREVAPGSGRAGTSASGVSFLQGLPAKVLTLRTLAPVHRAISADDDGDGDGTPTFSFAVLRSGRDGSWTWNPPVIVLAAYAARLQGAEPLGTRRLLLA